MLKIYNKSNIEELYEKLSKRADISGSEAYNATAEIVAKVKSGGDCALRKYTKELDNTDIECFKLPVSKINEALTVVDKNIIRIMEKASENIERFHKNQIKTGFVQTEDGAVMGQRVIPLERAALYVPGGSAAYPSTVLMNAIPAKLAGVNDIIMLTPPKPDGVNPYILAAAKIAGVDSVYTIGGAQAIAAAAYGTESVPRADKIVGPGNIYVTIAKKIVSGDVDIDMIAGPSEILIIADKDANPAYIAADLMSQAEHDTLASSILLTMDEELVRKVVCELERQLPALSRHEIIEKSLTSYGAAVIVDDISDALEISNKIAPEHLELAVKNPFEILDCVKNAGSVFLGEYTPEPVGDYYGGPNHVLPTNGTARFFSPLGVEDFVKRSSFIYYSKKKLTEAAGDIITFARSENLTAHANSIEVRVKNDG